MGFTGTGAGLLDTQSTIAAIASVPSGGHHGAVRVSGPQTSDLLRDLFPEIDFERRKAACYETAVGWEFVGFRLPVQLDSRSTGLDSPASNGTFTLPISVLYWPDHRSYTGAPSAELHTLGAIPVLHGVLNRVLAAGARLARPGEFTMRAFLAGRLDLTQAEAVLGVIDAPDRTSLDLSLRQLAGNVSKPLHQLRDDLLNLLADVEAGLDFVDEDIQFIQDDVLVARMRDAEQRTQYARLQMDQRGSEMDVPRVAMRGFPNVGKSRLLNALAGREVAIVADIAGTTRDPVTTEVQVEGRRICFDDTAGLESIGDVHSSGPEAAVSGIRKAAQVAAGETQRSASFILACVDLASCDLLSDDEVVVLSSSAVPHEVFVQADLIVGTKADCLDRERRLAVSSREGARLEDSDAVKPFHATSGVSGDGVEALLNRIADALSTQEPTGVAGTAVRCRDAMLKAARALDTGASIAASQGGHEWVAEEIRVALSALADVTGAVYTDDLLDRVFSRFCIGK